MVPYIKVSCWRPQYQYSLLSSIVRNVPTSLTVTREEEDPLTLQLRRVVGFLSPHFSLVLRDSHRVIKNSTAAHPSCLYRGEARERRILVAVSTCSTSVSAVVVIDGVPHSLEVREEERRRRRRQAETWETEGESSIQLEVLTDLTHEAECGLNERNIRRLMVTERPVVRLRRETRRSRRSAVERVIELGVFVDSQMYNNNKQGTEADTIDRIRWGGGRGGERD